ncbi:MAG: deoxyguanosinetriphosphate triphosphohydrolase [Pseudomonadota bacterium]
MGEGFARLGTGKEGSAGYGEGLAAGARSPGPYAASAIASRGRQHAEPDCPTRSPFQRDRDRILHSTPFRRLTYKTQVFVYHEGDHFRTRLTHSLEVAQIARTIARQLRLDEDLAEALALAHDLGHSPFGHAGERALDAVMRTYGGFDHNAQSLRVVLHLERKYQNFDGLNLSWETLEGLAKHNGPAPRGGAIDKVTRSLAGWRSLELDRYASAEAQVAALADDIAYVNHDIDDGLRAGLIAVSDLAGMPIVGALARDILEVRSEEPRRIYAVTRRMITAMIRDVVTESRRRLAALAPASPDDIRAAAAPVVAFSDPLARDLARLKAYLFERVYRHPRINKVMASAEATVARLFERYLAEPVVMPAAWHSAAAGLSERRLARLVGDFVSGMTDRYAIAEHARLFDATPELR